MRLSVRQSLKQILTTSHASAHLRNEKASHTDTLSKHKKSWHNSGMAVEEKTIARNSMVFALGALEKQVSDLKAVNFVSKSGNERVRPNPEIPTKKSTDFGRYMSEVHL